MFDTFKATIFGASMLALSCEALDLSPQSNLSPQSIDGEPKTVLRKTVGPDYPTDKAWLDAMKQNDTSLYYEQCSDCSEKSERIDLFMPIVNTTFNCDHNVFPLKETCWGGECGQIWGEKGTRNITVIIPKGFNDQNAAPLLVDIEGTDWFHLPQQIYDMARTTENKTFDIEHVYQALMDKFVGGKDKKRSLPQNLVYVAVGLAGPGSVSSVPFSPGFKPDNCGNGEGTPRDIELVTNSDRYVNFINNEVLPYVANELKAHYPNFHFTTNPKGKVISGQSNGAAAAFKAVFYKPEYFGTMIGYSAALFFGNLTTQDHTAHPLENADFWVPPPEGQGLIANEDPAKEKGRYLFVVAENDAGTPNQPVKCPNFPGPPTDYGDLAIAVNSTAIELAAKGHETRFIYALNTCHTDNKFVFTQTPEAVFWAFSEYTEATTPQPTSSPSGVSSLRGSVLQYLLN